MLTEGHMLHSGTSAILTYHSLDDGGSVLSTPPALFAEQMRILSELGVQVVPLSEVHRRLRGAALAEPVVAITFDDGFRSAYSHGLPILQRYGFPATIFLVTDYCGKMNAWPSQPLSIAPRLLLRWTEVKEMSTAGIAFGSHARTHPDLRAIAHHEVEEELVTSKRAIEDAIGRSADLFAYPYGVYNDTIKRIVQAYFTLACSAQLGFVTVGSDPFALERLDMYYLHRTQVFRRLFSREVGVYIRCRRVLRDLRGRRAERVRWG